MSTQTPYDIASYYANLLIKQYKAKPKAWATIFSTVAPILMCSTSTQNITFSDVATSGSFVLSYNGNNTASIAWNATTAAIQSDLQALPGMSSVTVSGSISSKTLTVTFIGVTPPAQLLVVQSNSLQNSSSQAVQITAAETDQILPLQVQNGFNLSGSNTAIGAQLDILGKYAGVTRNGNGVSGPITLSDSDFLILIKFAIAQNNSGSDLSTIVTNLYSAFGNNVLVFDYQNMQMSYLVSSSFGSQDLIQLLIYENLLPRPMTVQMSVIYAPDITKFFGFVTYQSSTAMNNSPFNTYESYQITWPWLDYADALLPVLSMGTEDGNTIVQENGDALYLG